MPLRALWVRGQPLAQTKLLCLHSDRHVKDLPLTGSQTHWHFYLPTLVLPGTGSKPPSLLQFVFLVFKVKLVFQTVALKDFKRLIQVRGTRWKIFGSLHCFRFCMYCKMYFKSIKEKSNGSILYKKWKNME